MSVRKRTWKNSRGEKEAWIVDYRDQQGARHIHTFARKKNADDYHATVKLNVRHGARTARIEPRKPITGIAVCCARAAIGGHPAAAPSSSVMNSRLLVCREGSIVRGDEGQIITRSSSRPEARSLIGCQTAN